jgi:hypothetical protein
VISHSPTKLDRGSSAWEHDVPPSTRNSVASSARIPAITPRALLTPRILRTWLKGYSSFGFTTISGFLGYLPFSSLFTRASKSEAHGSRMLRVVLPQSLETPVSLSGRVNPAARPRTLAPFPTPARCCTGARARACAPAPTVLEARAPAAGRRTSKCVSDADTQRGAGPPEISSGPEREVSGGGQACGSGSHQAIGGLSRWAGRRRSCHKIPLASRMYSIGGHHALMSGISVLDEKRPRRRSSCLQVKNCFTS